MLARPGHETIVHAGREELRFALHSLGKCPADLLDVQIAAGLIGDEYPAGYGSLIVQLLRVTTQKGETRTDWRRRPLSSQQIEYALDDVRYLIPLRVKLTERLANSVACPGWPAKWRHSRRKSSPAGLANVGGAARVCRDCRPARWPSPARYGAGARPSAARDRPARLVLRDDLLVELARRRTAEYVNSALRGLERGELQRALPILAEHIEIALDLPENDFPRPERRDVPNQINLLGQFLSTALTSLCRYVD